MTQLLQNAAYGTALILAAALLRRALKDRLTPGARLALWAVCLFRLLTPAAPESGLSLWGLARLLRPQQAPAAPAPAPAANAPQLYAPAQTGPSPAAPAISWETVLLGLWLAVGIALAVRYALSWARTRRAVACAIPVEQGDPRYASLPKCARLREGPMEGAPLTFGAVRPTVVLSPDLEGDALDCVLAHEGVHAARRDNLWHYAMAAALIIHWWNPAVWLMARLLRRDVELSCDRAALKKLGADRRADYAQVLVSLAAQGDGPAFCQTFGRKAAEERILSVMKFKKTSVIGAVLSLALVLAVTVAFASEPKQTATPDTLVADGVTLTGDAAKYASQLYAGMTRDEVHQLLGEPHNMLSGLYGDTYLLERLQGLPVTEPATEAPLFIIYYDYEDFNGGVSKVERVLYRTGDGEHIELIRSASEGRPIYVDPDRNAYDDYDSVKGGESGAIDPSLKEADEGKTLSDYDVKLPTFDEDGSSVAAGGGIVGSTGYSLGSTAPSAPCGMEGCTETRYHQHSGGYCFLLSDPCPVEGCTIRGSHEHNGVMYSCNGAGHGNGVCDGSCLVYSQPMQGAGNGYQHHGEGPHGNGHN